MFPQFLHPHHFLQSINLVSISTKPALVLDNHSSDSGSQSEGEDGSSFEL